MDNDLAWSKFINDLINDMEELIKQIEKENKNAE